jgi:hypothetical protein
MCEFADESPILHYSERSPNNDLVMKCRCDDKKRSLHHD